MYFRRIVEDPSRIKNAIQRRMPGTINVGGRAISKRIPCSDLTGYKMKNSSNSVEYTEDGAIMDTDKAFKKIFSKSPEARQSLTNELYARDCFKNSPWISPIFSSGDNWITLPYYPDDCRLDRIAQGLDRSESKEIARQALHVILDMLAKHFAHRDFHAKNMFWINKQLIVVDFEVMKKYPGSNLPSLSECYDMTGHGLESPYGTKNMSYVTNTESKMALQLVLDVTAEGAINIVKEDLKKNLNEASLSFAKKTGRHICKSERYYSSFSLLDFSISAEEAQRNSAIRYANFGLDENVIRSKSIVDFGCNTGGMLFEAQKYNPGHCLGIEFDTDKVEIASKIAAYAGLGNTEFKVGDIDKLNSTAIGQFHIVFCFAIEAHVKNTDHLYKLLSEVCVNKLYFEGNSTTDSIVVEQRLKNNGFKQVLYVGNSTDDIVPANNKRPLFIAEK